MRNGSCQCVCPTGTTLCNGVCKSLQTDEAKEGAAAFAEKRKPEFGKYVQNH